MWDSCASTVKTKCPGNVPPNEWDRECCRSALDAANAGNLETWEWPRSQDYSMGAEEELVPRIVQVPFETSPPRSPAKFRDASSMRKNSADKLQDFEDLPHMSWNDEGSIVNLPVPGLVHVAQELYLNTSEKGACPAPVVDRLTGDLVGFHEAAEARSIAAQKAASAAAASLAVPLEPAPIDVTEPEQGRVLEPANCSQAMPEDGALREDSFLPEPVMAHEEDPMSIQSEPDGSFLHHPAPQQTSSALVDGDSKGLHLEMEKCRLDEQRPVTGEPAGSLQSIRSIQQASSALVDGDSRGLHLEMEKGRLDERRPVTSEPAGSLQSIRSMAAKSKLKTQVRFMADQTSSAAKLAAAEMVAPMTVGVSPGAHNLVEAAAAALDQPANVSSVPQASISLETLLSDLEAAELQTYSHVWIEIAGDAGSMPLDSQPLRSILLEKTCIPPEELDTTLILAAPDLVLTLTGFLHLLRENTLADAAALQQFVEAQFVEASPNGEAVPAAALSRNLPEFLSGQLGIRLRQESWNVIVAATFSDAVEFLDVEQWLMRCKKAARVARLMKHLGH